MQWFVVAAHPLPCLGSCFCFYSIKDDANTVNCSYNNMTQLSQKLLSDTEQLEMIGNNFEVLNFINIDFASMKILDLQRCNIQQISDETLETLLSHVDVLKLSSNKLHQVPDILQKNKNTKIWFGDNPFECNCNMMWMRDWLLNDTNVLDKEHIFCTGGPWKGKQFQMLHLNDQLLYCFTM